MTFDCAAHSPEQEAALSRRQGGGHRNALSGQPGPAHARRQRVLCRLLREGVVHVQGENTPTPVAARVIVP